MTKFELVRKQLIQGNEKRPSLLDVGCRGCELNEYVRDLVSYSGVDLFQNAQGSVAFVCDVEQGIPVGDESYDYVVALDLIEHLNDFQKGLEELLRIARIGLMIMLPNTAYLTLRKEYFLHGSFSRLTSKYDLVYGLGADRHRWITVLPQMDEYMRSFAQDKNLDIEVVWFNDSWKKIVFQKIGSLIGLPPSWWVWSSFYILNKKK